MSIKLPYYTEAEHESCTTLQIQQEESRPYYNFINSIRSKSSKLSYCGELRRYLRHYNIQTADQLLELPDKEPKIIDYILQQKGFKSRQLTINALKKFYEMNDVILNWKKITCYLGEEQKLNEDPVRLCQIA